MALKLIENQVDTRLDWLKWSMAVFLLCAGCVGNYYYSEISVILRAVGWLVLLAVSALVASKTKKGKQIIEFFAESRIELRKVVWPTRQETTQMTLIIVGVVVLLAFVLWGIDGILVWLIGLLTGQRS